MPVTYEDIKHRLQPPLDCTEVKDLRGRYFYNRLVTNYEHTDLTGCVLYHCYPSGIPGAIEVSPAQSEQEVTLKGANLEQANFAARNFKGANLMGVNLRGADLLGSNLQGANLEGANLEGANLEGANLRGANLHSARLDSTEFSWADLRDVNFTDTKILEMPSLLTRGSLVSQRELVRSSKREQYFIGPNSDLEGAEFSNWLHSLRGSNLEGSNFEDADLQHIDLRDSNLQNVDFSGADLRMADLRGADLRGAYFGFAILERIKIDGAKYDLETSFDEAEYMGPELPHDSMIFIDDYRD